jgi:hypothetical protein
MRSSPQKPRLPPPGFSLTAFIRRRLPDAHQPSARRADRRRRARAAVRKLFLIKPLGHARLRFAGVRADHRSGIELAAIDATTAANGRDGWRADFR